MGTTRAAADTKPRRARWFHGGVSVILAALCVLLYGWTVDFPMEFDDYVYLENNPLMQDARSFRYMSEFRDFVNRPGQKGLDPDLAANFILRPVAYATFHLNYKWDGFRPRWFRVINIGIHAANALLIYAMLTVLLRRSTKRPALSVHSIRFIAATAGALFAVHPLATESVTYIVQRFTSLGTFFYLLTLLLHFVSNSIERPGLRWLLRGTAAAVLAMGMLTKECTFTAPVMAVLLDRLVTGTSFKKALLNASLLLLCLPIIPCQVMLVSWAQNDGVLSLRGAIHLAASKDIPLEHWHFIVTELTVVLSYLRLLFWPTNLNLDPDWPVHRSLLEWPVLPAVMVIAAILAGTWILHRRNREKPASACVFAFAAWFFVTVIVSSGLAPLPDLMAEHRSYLPSIGIFVAVACLLDRFRIRCDRLALPQGLTAILAVELVLTLSWATWERNQVWRTETALWEDNAAKSPGKWRVWGNLGVAYSKTGRHEDSLRCYRKAEEIDPRIRMTRINIITALNNLQRYQDALDECNGLFQIDPQSIEIVAVQHGLGLALLGVGKVGDGIATLEQTVARSPNHRNSHLALGMAYSHIGRPRRALKHLNHVVALGSANPEPVVASLIQEAKYLTGGMGN